MIKLELIVLGIFVLAINYSFYQLVRLQKVDEIKDNWRISNNPKFDKYTYDYMFDPSFKNWLGLKFPSKSDF